MIDLESVEQNEIERINYLHGKRAPKLIQHAKNKFTAYRMRHDENMTFKEIGDYFNISAEPARQYVLYVERLIKSYQNIQRYS